MNNKEFARKLEERTRKFAVQIIKLSTKLPNSSEGRVISTQLTKAGTSIGEITGRLIGPGARRTSKTK